ncbi:MAG: hypothetical protein PHH87_02475 [Desulfuromonas sp.]|nr:hypothetical protein [Desulfuromonas sp.]
MNHPVYTAYVMLSISTPAKRHLGCEAAAACALTHILLGNTVVNESCQYE